MTKNILVLCTGNSARSIMGEAYINHAAKGAWHAYSAGSKPTGQVNPLAIKTLREAGIEVSDARSKSWDEFSEPDAPQMQVVITVCDNAANEVCPIWPGAPIKWHWPFADPAAVEGTEEEKAAAFRTVFEQIRNAVDAFLAGKPGDDISRERKSG